MEGISFTLKWVGVILWPAHLQVNLYRFLEPIHWAFYTVPNHNPLAGRCRQSTVDCRTWPTLARRGQISMPVFEVFIPAAGPDDFNITARIDAGSWIQALRNGLAKLGVSADVQNIMVDMTDDAIEVTDPQSGRVFRIKEIAAAAPPAAAPPAAASPAAAPPAAAPPAAAPPAAAPPAAAPPAAASSAAASVQAPHPNRFAGDVGAEMTFEQTTGGEHESIGRGKAAEARSVEDILGDLFEKTQELYDQPDMAAAARFLMDLAMRSVPSESGAVFLSDISASTLSFAAAAGPKAQEVMDFKVPLGQGIVGFCAQEGVSLAISDVHRNPYFFAAISKKLGYETRSILCSPAQSGGRVYGAVELINKTGGSSFTNDEVNVLNFLSHEFADYIVNSGHGI